VEPLGLAKWFDRDLNRLGESFDIRLVVYESIPLSKISRNRNPTDILPIERHHPVMRGWCISDRSISAL